MYFIFYLEDESSSYKRKCGSGKHLQIYRRNIYGKVIFCAVFLVSSNTVTRLCIMKVLH